MENCLRFLYSNWLDMCSLCRCESPARICCCCFIGTIIKCFSGKTSVRPFGKRVSVQHTAQNAKHLKKLQNTVRTKVKRCDNRSRSLNHLKVHFLIQPFLEGKYIHLALHGEFTQCYLSRSISLSLPLSLFLCCPIFYVAMRLCGKFNCFFVHHKEFCWVFIVLAKNQLFLANISCQSLFRMLMWWVSMNIRNIALAMD